MPHHYQSPGLRSLNLSVHSTNEDELDYTVVVLATFYLGGIVCFLTVFTRPFVAS